MTNWKKTGKIGQKLIFVEFRNNLNIEPFYQQRLTLKSNLFLSVYDHCSCVPYYYVRNSSQPVCDNNSTQNCFAVIQNILNPALHATKDVCRCLPSCNYVSYSYKMYQNALNPEMSGTNTTIKLRWKDSEFYAMFRYEQLKLVDFLSYVGGILGLFAGISVLSIVELIYFLTLRLFNDLLGFI